MLVFVPDTTLSCDATIKKFCFTGKPLLKELLLVFVPDSVLGWDAIVKTICFTGKPLLKGLTSAAYIGDLKRNTTDSFQMVKYNV